MRDAIQLAASLAWLVAGVAAALAALLGVTFVFLLRRHLSRDLRASRDAARATQQALEDWRAKLTEPGRGKAG